MLQDIYKFQLTWKSKGYIFTLRTITVLSLAAKTREGQEIERTTFVSAVWPWLLPENQWGTSTVQGIRWTKVGNFKFQKYRAYNHWTKTSGLTLNIDHATYKSVRNIYSCTKFGKGVQRYWADITWSTEWPTETRSFACPGCVILNTWHHLRSHRMAIKIIFPLRWSSHRHRWWEVTYTQGHWEVMVR